MGLSQFIIDNMEAIVEEWLDFATTMEPAASTMSALALRDHAKPILLAIAKDLTSEQTALAQEEKSKGQAPSRRSARETAAATHGALRHMNGFDLNQLGAEYRALRASVIRLWTRHQGNQMDSAVIEDMIRFNEAVDQAVAESTSRYAAELALSRDTFIAILAHDLRSPLNAITMLSHILERAAATDAVRQQADQLRRSAGEMGSMISDLLEYTRTNLGKGVPVSMADCDVAQLCRDAAQEIRAARPRLCLVLQVPPEIRAHVDATRIRQALSNLLNNAVHHGDPDSAVTLSAKTEGGMLVLQVMNQGEPIPAESLQVIFDPLVQLATQPGTQHRPSSSLGLGLFIVREVAVGHGGTIEAASSQAEGTVFTLRIPLGRAAPP